MSDESIPCTEDIENLMYIARNIYLDDMYSEEHSYFRESSSSEQSEMQETISEAEVEYLKGKRQTESGPQIFRDPSVLLKTRPFNLEWSYGCNPKVDIINLTDEDTNEIIFASSHFPIIYNYCQKEMSYLEGHHHSIVSISLDRNARYLVTADNGEEGFLNVWDAHMRNTDTGKIAPVLSMYSIYQKYGISIAQISPCSRFIITVGALKDDLYSIDMWLWTYGNEQPEAKESALFVDSVHVSNVHGIPIAVRYNPNVTEHIMVIFSKQVFLLTWDTETKTFTSNVTPQIMHRNKIGHITTGTYVDKCHECYTTSSKGCILTFSNALYAKPYEEGNLDNNKIFRNAVKISDVSVDCCTTIDGLIVTGDLKGRIYFFTNRLMILYWLTTFNLGPISSISFNLIPKVKYQNNNKYFVIPSTEEGMMNCDFLDKSEELAILTQGDVPIDASINRTPFLIRDFFLTTAQANIYAIDIFNNKCISLFHLADDHVAAIEIHEESDYIIIAYKSDRIIIMNYLTNEIVSESHLPKGDNDEPISCIKYSGESLHLVCGKVNGEIWILEPILLNAKHEPFQITKNRVVKILFSPFPVQFAYYDDNRTVVVFQYNNDIGKWEFKGKIRPHYEPITDILFIPINNVWKLCSVAEDRHIIEYNNDELDTKDFTIKTSERIEQTAIPLAMTYWVTTEKKNQVGYIILADDKHKLKFLFQSTKIPKATVLAPAFGCFRNQLIRKMQIIPQSDSKYMVFCTKKHCGIHMLPPDGNPYQYVGYLTHPVELRDFVISRDGKLLFTYGVNDHCVIKWNINTSAAEKMRHLGGKELEPYYCLIEGGYHGWLFHEIKDLFYYMQILQTENIDLPRRVSDTINISELPDLFRTIGFYPTDFELENIILELKYRGTKTSNIDISFTEFVRLYCNHKPVYGYSLNELQEAFNIVVENYAVRNKRNKKVPDTIDRNTFIKILTTEGEPMSTTYAFQCFKCLMRVEQVEENFKFLPEQISFNTLIEDILGIDMDRDKVLEPEDSSEDEDMQNKDVSITQVDKNPSK